MEILGKMLFILLCILLCLFLTSSYSSLRAQYEEKHGPSNNDLERAEEDMKEVSLSSQKEFNHMNNNSILWENIEEKLKDNKDLDEDEVLELRHNLEQKKREALIIDMLSSAGVSQPDNDKLKILTESKKPLDLVLENANARKNFMLM